MSNHYSKPVEVLIAGAINQTVVCKSDVVIVGSGYGAAMAAVQLANKKCGRVVVLEKGAEYLPGEFPQGMDYLPKHLRYFRNGEGSDKNDTGYPGALFNIHIGDRLDVLVGSGLGGTSLINANVMLRPKKTLFEKSAWPNYFKENKSHLSKSFAAVENILGVSINTSTNPVAKFRSFEKFTRSQKVEAKRAPLSVNFSDEPLNVIGHAQSKCTECGNCITGCNVGAKGSLADNVIPLAKARGAEFYTMAKVLSVVKNENTINGTEYPWLVRFKRTSSEMSTMRDEVFFVQCKKIILAAGTLGSSEILMRSQRQSSLKFSEQLGQRYSNNGDGIHFGFAQKNEINAVGQNCQLNPNKKVGTTITATTQLSISDPKTGNQSEIVVQDGAIPYGLSRVFGESLATGAQFHRLNNRQLPKGFISKAGLMNNLDPLAVNSAVMNNTQMFLVMGDDQSRGSIHFPELGKGSIELDQQTISLKWPADGQYLQAAAEQLFQSQDRAEGLDGGQFVPNPLQTLLPNKAAQIMGGALPSGRLVSVHPLGGCCMGDDIQKGVVDYKGQVFSGENADPSGVYEGLYVLDGSILPSAVGVNPALLIAGLAWGAAESIRDTLAWQKSGIDHLSASDELDFNALKIIPFDKTKRDRVFAPSHSKVDFEFTEQLIGSLNSENIPKWFNEVFPASDRWFEKDGLILKAALSIDDIEARLENFGDTAIQSKLQLFTHPLSVQTTANEKPYGITIADDEKSQFDLKGNVHLLSQTKSTRREKPFRAINALRTFHLRRNSLFQLKSDPKSAQSISFVEKVKGFVDAAFFHTDYRLMEYEFTLDSAVGQVTLSGLKEIKWRHNHSRLWESLITLPIEIRCDNKKGKVSGELKVDLAYLVDKGLVQVSDSPDMLATLSSAVAMSMFFLRVILQTHFWEFGAPVYPARALNRQPCPLPIEHDQFGLIQPETIEYDVKVSKTNSHKIKLRLTHYPRGNHKNPSSTKKAPPILLIHGLAQGSQIFCTDTIDVNMASFFYQEGFDVWLLDYRLSNALPEGLNTDAWYLEDMAEFDLPPALSIIYERTGEQAINVFAHCVGATMTSMAILSGFIEAKYLAKVSFNAIHLWPMPAPANQVRMLLGKYLAELIGDDLLDPIPQPTPTVTQSMFDRIAFSLARVSEDASKSCKDQDSCAHIANGGAKIEDIICDRMTVLYGRMWRHQNLDPRTHEGFQHLTGPAPSAVYRQLQYILLKEALADKDGNTRFLTSENFNKYWTMPTLFVHGEESEVFNAYSAELSAQRLRAIHKANGAESRVVKLKRVKNYGHMDIVFAKHAYEHVFPMLVEFFSDAQANEIGITHNNRPDTFDVFDESLDDSFQMPKIITGPILRSAERLPNSIMLKYWLELDVNVNDSRDSFALEGDCLSYQWRRCEHAFDENYRMLDIEIALDKSLNTRILQRCDGGQQQWSLDLDKRNSCLSRLNKVRHQPYGDINGNDDATDTSRFIVGSCRFPGSVFEHSLSDKVFLGIEKHCETTPLDHVFFLGDQIYADASGGVFDPDSLISRYVERYRLAFRSKYFASLALKAPVHFSIDDHEFSIDWSGLPESLRDNSRELNEQASYLFALQAAKNYQHSGMNRDSLWYALSNNESAVPMFMMDSRSERENRLAYKKHSPKMIADEQWRALSDWLLTAKNEYPEKPKFIFSGVVIAPIHKSLLAFPETWRNQDGWIGYPETLDKIITLIVKHAIQNVVFVGGDLHLSCVAKLQLHCEGYSSVNAWQIVSSGLYAPVPFANDKVETYEWQLNQAFNVPGHQSSLSYQASLVTTNSSHFIKVETHLIEGQWTMLVQAYDSDGELLDWEGGQSSQTKNQWDILFERDDNSAAKRIVNCEQETGFETRLVKKLS